MSAARGIGTVIQARGAMWQVKNTLINLILIYSRNGTGLKDTASQPEILSYANHVADRFDLRRGNHA
jgi:hypothetical protein